MMEGRIRPRTAKETGIWGIGGEDGWEEALSPRYGEMLRLFQKCRLGNTNATAKMSKIMSE